MSKYENRFPGSVGFINDSTEIFAVRENLFNKLFRPHFHLYDHENGEIQTFRFDQLDKCSTEVLNFLGTTRAYSLNKERCMLPRTYYIDLVTEWEILNGCYMRRKFLWI